MKTFTRNSFLFPTPKKLILAAALFFIFGWIAWPSYVVPVMTDWQPTGFPLAIHAEGFCPLAPVCIDFDWMALIGDAVIWYLVSALMIQARLSIWLIGLYIIIGIIGMWLPSFLLRLAERYSLIKFF